MSRHKTRSRLLEQIYLRLPGRGTSPNDPHRKSLGDYLREGLARIWAWIKSKFAERKAKRALQALVAATVGSAVAVAGVVVNDRLQALQDRVEVVEDRPVAGSVDLAPMRAQAGQLTRQVAMLQGQTDRLLARIERVGGQASTAADDAGDAQDDVDEVMDEIRDISGSVRAGSAELDNLAAKIRAAAAQSSVKRLGGQLSSLATSVAGVTSDMSSKLDLIEEKIDDLDNTDDALSSDIAGLRADLAGVSAGLTDLSDDIEGFEDSVDDLKDGLPLAIAQKQIIIGDGQTQTRDVGSLSGGDYVIQWTSQDNYGCNGDQVKLLSDGLVVASYNHTYGSCSQQPIKYQQFTLPDGDHDMEISIGCLPPGNGTCKVDLVANITKAGAHE